MTQGATGVCATCARFRRSGGCPNGIMAPGDRWDGHDGGCSRWTDKRIVPRIMTLDRWAE